MATPSSNINIPSQQNGGSAGMDVNADVANASFEIHHVDVGHGDATVILVKAANGKIRNKVLIDASTSRGVNALVRYFVENFSNSDFEYVIPSHYHDDHLNGLGALGGSIQGVRVFDLGGYDLTDAKLVDKDAPKLTDAEKARLAANNPKQGLQDAPYLPPESKMFNCYLGGVRHSVIVGSMERVNGECPGILGQKIPLFDLADVPVTLTPIAGNGYVINSNVRKTGGDHKNPNNYSYAFLLEYGAFRYFTGGDLGGSGGTYVDHETLVATALKNRFAAEGGHVCAMKANHHGSDHSNNATFLGVLSPAVCVTSVGTNKAHRLPGGEFLERLNQTQTPGGSQGFFFTHLADYPAASKEQALRRTQATELFGKRNKTIFDHGADAGISYVIRVNAHDKARTESIFSVHEGSDPYFRILKAKFNCHTAK